MFTRYCPRLIHVLVLLAIALAAACSPITEPMTEATPLESTIRIAFQDPVILEEALTLARDNEFVVGEIEHTFTLGSEPITGFYPVPEGLASADISHSLAAAHQAFLEDLAQSSVAEDGARIGGTTLSTAHLRQLLEAARQQHKIWVTGLLVTGDSSGAAKIRSTLGVREVSVRAPTQNSGFGPSLSHGGWHWAQPNTWAPRSGMVATGVSSAQERYVRQDMVWDNVSGFAYETATYEHDFFLNNYASSTFGAGTYLTLNEGVGRMPQVTYAASNLPMAYLDTRLGDPLAERAYTIGSAAASIIVRGVWYMSYIRTKNGTANLDNGKLVAQVGHRSPKGCYSTWCSYGDQWHTLVSAWNIPVPGTRSWSR